MTTERVFQIDDDLEAEDHQNGLSVLEIIAGLQAMEASLFGDPCLDDLRVHLSAIRIELEERRRLAAEVADEATAEMLQVLN